jgi:hypothetical protein
MDPEQSDFLAAVSASASRRVVSISRGGMFYRAQIGSDLEPHFELDANTGQQHFCFNYDVPYREERLFPLPDRATEGRANPKGISVLYCASDVDTAIAEMRPSVGALLSYGHFEPTRKLRIVDCTRNRMEKLSVTAQIRMIGNEPEPKVREQYVWSDIDQAFSDPVLRSDDTAEYAPTQILAEVFRRDGFDGARYNSSYGRGKNYVFFEPMDFRILQTDIVRVTRTKVWYEHSEDGRF